MESSLREKRDYLKQAETQLQLNASLQASAQAENNDLMAKCVVQTAESIFSCPQYISVG